MFSVNTNNASDEKITLELTSIFRNAGIHFPAHIRSYQWKGIKFLIERDVALLSDEMGLGKTIQTAVAIQLLLLRKIHRILVVVPTSLSKNWEFELKRWAPKAKIRRIIGDNKDRIAHYRLPFNIWIASYEQIRADIDFLWHEPIYDIVVIDEAQRIKNPDSQLAIACKQLPRKKAWSLTGTPVENSTEDLISIFNFLKPGLLKKGFTRNEIHDHIMPYFLRRKKKDVLGELPPVIIQDINMELEAKQQEAYENEWYKGRQLIRQHLGKISTAILLTQITRLKILCNFDPISEQSCKLDTLKTILDGLNEEKDKIIIFSQYVDTLKRIKDNLYKIPMEIFHGGLSIEERSKIINNFENFSGPRGLLISIKAGGIGLNLNSASIVVLFDRWWNPAVEEQAIQRAHRFGKTHPLQVIRFLVNKTIEVRINSILKEKRNLFKNIIENAKLPDVSFLTKEDLFKILSLEFVK